MFAFLTPPHFVISISPDSLGRVLHFIIVVQSKLSVKFIQDIQKILGISSSNTFVVPGNHDITRDSVRTLLVSDVCEKYNSQDGIVDSIVLDHLQLSKKNYLSSYKAITGVRREDNHFYIKTKDANFVHINTALLSSKNGEDGSLIVGMQLLRDALADIDTSIPAVVLAHHGFDCLKKEEQYQLESLLKEKNAALYLCGHCHTANSKLVMSSRQDKELWECCCGTHMNGNMVDMDFLTGDYDDSGNMWIIEAHKWSTKFSGWMVDIDFSFPQGGALDGKCYFPVSKRFQFVRVKSASKKMPPLLGNVGSIIIPDMNHNGGADKAPPEDKVAFEIELDEKSKSALGLDDSIFQPALSCAINSTMEATHSDSDRVFVSYSWDSEEHRKAVNALVSDLRKDGVNVVFDADMKLGDRITTFMERSISESAHVLLIGSPLYKEKADKRSSGVGYENAIISGELYHSSNERKFIPVLLSGNWMESLPTWAIGKLGVDLRDSRNREAQYRKLVYELKSV